MNKTDKLQPLQEMAMAYANSLPGAKAYWRDDWETYYFEIMGKMFGIVHDNVITLKNDPYINTELREQFPFIIPGYHQPNHPPCLGAQATTQTTNSKPQTN